jgi:hypothetical protein
MVLNLAHPVVYILETLGLRAVVRQYYALSPFVISLSNCAEPFLASCVPYLDLHVFTIEVDRSDFEVNSYTNTKVSG